MTIEEVTGLFIRDYLVMSYLGNLGAIQLGASFSGLRGFLFLRTPWRARALGAVLIASGMIYFFTAPLWNEGPWSNDPSGPPVRGAEGKIVHWGFAEWSNLPEARNINDVDGGISGTGQGLWFPAGAAGALVTTVVLASLLNRRLDAPVRDPRLGMEVVGETVWLRAVPQSIRAWRSHWREDLAEEFEPGPQWHPIRALAARWRER